MDDSRRCTATSRSGERCKRAAITGGTVCRMHGGAAPQVQAAAEERAVIDRARREADRLGVPIQVDPGEALLQSLFEREGNVAFYRSLVQELAPEEGGLYVAIQHSDGDGGMYETGEAKPHVLVELYNREMRERDQVAVALLRAGVEERRMQLAEGQAQRIAAFARGLLAELGIDPASPKARAAFRKHLELVAGGDTE